MSRRLLTVAIEHEQDVVGARQRARRIAELLGFDVQDQTRIATAVSEIARNAFRYAGGGRVEFALEGEQVPQLLVTRIADKGPGIADLQAILHGRYASTSGLGLGIAGSRRLMDRFDIRTRPGEGTEITLTKMLPAGVPRISAEGMAELAAALASSEPLTALQELEQQNRELIRTLSDLRERQEEMERLNRELEDTNRGVVALYAELDERADHLRRADETKTRFLSSMSHELRTPLNSIRALSRLLLDGVDGPLGEEQTKQVKLIRKATEDLSQIVDDLLDIAKIAAGKTEVQSAEFSVADLFGMLRGMLRPLLAGDRVTLHFDDVSTLPALHTDEGKLSQILRNLISNALKFTERGEVRVSAEMADPATLCIRVADTGIGIAPEDEERIFDEFTQVAGPMQSRVKGTGLGLPLSSRLARLLGGTLTVQSTLGAGSTFCVTLPLRYPGRKEAPGAAVEVAPDPHRLGLLVVTSDADALAEYEQMLQGSAFQVLPARTLSQAGAILRSARPSVVVLDAELPGENAWAWLSETRNDPATRHVPLIVAASAHDPDKAYALGADACLGKPLSRIALIAQLDALTASRVLVIDDDPTARYTVRRFLGPQVAVLEAEDGIGGLRAAARLRPSFILLDLQLPDLHGGEVLKQLKASPTTRDIPVAMVTSLELDPDAVGALARQGATIVSKGSWSAQTLLELLPRGTGARTRGLTEA